jgi:hypothetical protein
MLAVRAIDREQKDEGQGNQDSPAQPDYPRRDSRMVALCLSRNPSRS